MAVFTFTYIVLGAILKLLFYLVYGICMAVSISSFLPFGAFVAFTVGIGREN